MSKQGWSNIVFVLAGFWLPAICAAAQKSSEGTVDAFLGDPRMDIQSIFEGGRFPNLVVTMKGTLLATWANKNVLARRSEDGGKFWGDEVTIAESGFQGGGLTVDETSGDILAFVEQQHPPAPLTVYRSRDDGKTWIAEEVTIQTDSRGNLPSMHMNEHGITLRHGEHQGRLLRASRFYGKRNDKSEWPTHYANAIYSDDGGTTWQTSDPFPENGTGEAAVAELSDGRIYYNSRVHWQERPDNRRRRGAFSDDGGHTWKDYRIIKPLPDGPLDTNYGCMGGLTRLPVEDVDILIYSNCDSPKGRNHGTVWASFDGGQTWPSKRLIYEGEFAYSSLTVGRPGTSAEGLIFLQFESQGAKLATFNLAWLLAGSATGDGVVPRKLAK